MSDKNTSDSHRTTDIHSAKREVARAKRALSSNMKQASAAGEATLSRVMAAARPALIGAAVAVGVVWVISMIRRSKRPRLQLPAESGRSVLGEVARSAVISLGTVAARRFAERALSGNHAVQSTPAGRAGAPRPAGSAAE
jgi:hypothetical protein